MTVPHSGGDAVGVVDQLTSSVDDGIDHAAATLSAGNDDDLHDLADHLMTTMMPADGYHDDVAILIYRRPTPLELRFPARPAEMAPARAALRRWLATAGAAPQLSCDALLATGEAMANAVEHGHRDQPDGTITVRAATVGATLRLSVCDTGRWKAPDPDHDGSRGRGISLMKALMDDVAVKPGDDGTTVLMSVSLR